MNSCLRTLVCTTLTCALGWIPAPLYAASINTQHEPESGGAEAAAPSTVEAAPQEQVGGTVALLRFTGDPDEASLLRESVLNSLTERGYEPKGIKRDVSEAAQKNDCETIDDACHQKIGAYLNKNAKTPFRFFVYGEAASAGGEIKIVAYDIEQNKTIRQLTGTVYEGDFILKTILPTELAKSMMEHQQPAPPLSAEEEKKLAELDEPQKSAEELAEEEKKIREALEGARKVEEEEEGFDGSVAQVEDVDVDLKKDFKLLCRNGPRNDERVENEDGSVDINRDLSPACKRGPFFGYWQPRAWVVGGLTVGLGLGTIISYSLALGARTKWNKAKERLEGTDGLDPMNPDALGEGSSSYSALATDVVAESERVRRFALTGDILLGSTVLMAAILGLTIYMDRQAAKGFLKQKKGLSLSKFRVSPVVDPFTGQVGASAQLNF